MTLYTGLAGRPALWWSSHRGWSGAGGWFSGEAAPDPSRTIDDRQRRL